MPNFLITYRGLPHVDPAQMAQAREAFGNWLQQPGDAVLDPGRTDERSAHVAAGSPVAAEIGGYSIVEAESAADVVTLLQTHPFVARGGTLQVNEPVAI
jgi:hypothetical protein